MMTKEEILHASVEWEDFCIALRRDFHRHPELSGQEVRTIARICEELREAGLSPIEVENGMLPARRFFCGRMWMRCRFRRTPVTF